jgi:4'-phosphopantetheinyl transferase
MGRFRALPDDTDQFEPLPYDAAQPTFWPDDTAQSTLWPDYLDPPGLPPDDTDQLAPAVGDGALPDSSADAMMASVAFSRTPSPAEPVAESAKTTVHLFYALTRDAGRFRALLSAHDEHRAAQYSRAADIDRCIASAGLLQQAADLIAAAGPPVARVGRWCRSCGQLADHGRPVALDVKGRPISGVFLSSSHAGPVVVVAASTEVPVGVDIEMASALRHWLASDITGFDRLTLSPVEQAALDRLEPDRANQARLRVWVRKEAVLKAVGVGLAVEPRLLTLRGSTLAAWPPELDAELTPGVTVVNFAPPVSHALAALAVLHSGAFTVVRHRPPRPGHSKATGA